MATLNGSKELMHKLEEIAKRMGGGEVAVGFMEGSKYPDGTSVPSVAYWNEFGTSKIPARPFFRTMIANESPTWTEKMGELAKEMDYDGERVLALMGENIGGALVQCIVDFTTPALAQSTIDAKGFSKPLTDTNNMKRSVHYQVNSMDKVRITVGD